MVNFLPHGGGRYTGSLTVTNKKLYYDAKFDTSVGGVLKELLVVKGSSGYLCIPKDQITEIKEKSSFFNKKICHE